MKKIVIALTVVLCTLLGGYGLTQLHSVAYAQGQQAAIDAGSAIVAAAPAPDAPLVGSGSAVPESQRLHDVVSDPGDFLGDVKEAKHKGWFALVLVLVYGGLVALGKLDKTVPFLAFLNKGKTAMAIAGGVVVVGAAMNMLFDGGTLVSVGVAALTAFVGLLIPKTSKDPAK